MADAGGKEAIRGFIHDYLVPTVVSTKSPSAINVMARFAAYLSTRGTPRILAEERAEKWWPQLIEWTQQELDRWENFGTNRPACFAEDERTLLTWNHPKFEDRTGFPSTSMTYFEALCWIRRLDPKGFLIPCAVFLSSLGANPIYITDGSGDEGVDLIGMIREGPLRATTVFVQAKAGGRISRDAMLLEYGKYGHLPHTKKYGKYRAALPEVYTGSSFIYTVVARAGFASRAQEIAGRLGILLRSDIQLAKYIEERYSSMSAVCEMEDRMRDHLIADLTYNVARLL